MQDTSPLQFRLENQVGQARAGRLTLVKSPAQGGGIWEIPTPLFMPVGTAGSVKGLSPFELKTLGAQIVLGNTYHLSLRPGAERVARFGGLQKFMNWSGPMLTDSGGFQVFSLAALNAIDNEGVSFRSHLDGRSLRFTPEYSMEIQKHLGAQIVMSFDQCPPYPASREQVRGAMDRTYAWGKRGLQHELQPHQARFGIVQGGLFSDLRRESVEQMTSLPFHGFSLGGLSIGEPPAMMQAMARLAAPLLPSTKPRYLMGVGRPEDIVEGILAGIDLFDCVMPTRNARNGQLFTSTGKINIKNAQYADSSEPLDEECPCETCLHYTRGYLRHLSVSQELLGARLNTLHNVTYYLRLTQSLRTALLENRVEAWVKDFYGKQGRTRPPQTPMESFVPMTVS